jgi:uncharacterized membrane protein YeaQ/YmgE (transglycosylase-associated protein family)
VELILILLIGPAVGVVASRLINRGGSKYVRTYLIVGVIGASIGMLGGRFVLSLLGVFSTSLNELLITATIGAVTVFLLAKVSAILLGRASTRPEPAETPAAASGAVSRTPSGRGRTPYGSVFISYRRDRGADTARLIRRELESRGWRVFLDVDDLGSSYFDERLLYEIDKMDNFLIILSAGALDRCAEEDDFLRREIAHALSRKKRIIPVLKDGFSFPPKESLPFEIRELSRHNGVPYSHDFFDATLDKLVSFLAPSGDGPHSR